MEGFYTCKGIKAITAYYSQFQPVKGSWLFKSAISNFTRSVLAKRLLIGILLFSSMVTLITTLVVLISDYREDISTTEKSLRQIEASNLNSLALSIWNYDDGQIYLQLDGILNFPAISYVALLSTHNVLYERGEKQGSGWLEVIELPVIYQEQEVANLTMHIDFGALYQRLFNKALIIMGSQFIKTLFVSLFILALVQSIITKHLVKMSEYAQELNLDNLHKVLTLDRKPIKDELSSVAYSVNYMRENLRQDIVKRKQTEQALNDNQKRLQLALDTANLGIMQIDMNDYSCEADERFAEQLGFKLEEFQCLSDTWQWWLDQIREQDRNNITSAIEKLLNNEIQTTSHKIEIIPSKSGKNTQFFRLMMVIMEHGLHKYLLCSQWEITDQVRNQQDIELLNSNLEDQIKERTIELQNSNQELKDSFDKLEKLVSELESTQGQLILKEKMATLGQMLFGVAHELNTPLGICTTAISGIEQMIAQSRETAPDSPIIDANELEEYSVLISNNLSRSIQVIKAFKALNVDQSEVLDVINLFEYLESYIQNTQPELPLTVQIDLKGDRDIYISSYPKTLKKVLDILVYNAKVHAFENEQQGIITIDINTDSENAIIHVFDNGKGISELEKQKIFDAFFTTKRNQGGLGLGLNIAYNLVHGVLGGYIHCDSDNISGSVFIINLPIHLSEERSVASQINLKSDT